MNDFDDFVDISGDLEEQFLDLSKRYVRIFLSKINAKNVQDVGVKFVRQPFLDVAIAFLINGQVVFLDHEYIKLKSLKARYDATLANIFNSFDYKKIEELCQKLKQELLKIYLKKRWFNGKNYKYWWNYIILWEK